MARKFSYHNICLVKLNECLRQVSLWFALNQPTTSVVCCCGLLEKRWKVEKSVCYHDFNEWELSFIDTWNFLSKSITSTRSFHTFALCGHSCASWRTRGDDERFLVSFCCVSPLAGCCMAKVSPLRLPSPFQVASRKGILKDGFEHGLWGLCDWLCLLFGSLGLHWNHLLLRDIAQLK